MKTIKWTMDDGTEVERIFSDNEQADFEDYREELEDKGMEYTIKEIDDERSKTI